MDTVFRPEKVCISCMKELPDDASDCPNCGFERENYRPKPHHLPPYEISHGRYMIGAVIGEGGFGITYSAYDLVSDRHVAIKELFIKSIVRRVGANITISNNEPGLINYFNECKQKFLQEGEALRTLEDKSGVVDIFDYYLENGTAYLVMEFLDGYDLLTYLKENGGKVSVKDAFEMLRPVMKSMIEIHRAGIIHRDISPDNIRCLPNHNMKLMDFGSAKFTTKTSNSMLILVKSGYAPPEQYVQNYRIGAWIDVYSMGATFYRCITGKVPKPSPERKNDADLDLPSELGVDIPEAAERVLLKAMALKTEDRYQDMYEFYNKLKKATREAPPDDGGKPPTSDPYKQLLDELNASADHTVLSQSFIIIGAAIDSVLISYLLTRFVL